MWSLARYGGVTDPETMTPQSLGANRAGASSDNRTDGFLAFWKYDEKFLTFSPGKIDTDMKFCVITGITDPLEAFVFLNQVEDKLGFAQPVTPGHPPPASGSASTSLAAPPLYSSTSCLCLASWFNSRISPNRPPCLCLLRQGEPSIRLCVPNITHPLNFSFLANSSLSIFFF